MRALEMVSWLDDSIGEPGPGKISTEKNTEDNTKVLDGSRWNDPESDSENYVFPCSCLSDVTPIAILTVGAGNLLDYRYKPYNEKFRVLDLTGYLSLVEAEQKCLGILFQSPKLALLIIAIRTERRDTGGSHLATSTTTAFPPIPLAKLCSYRTFVSTNYGARCRHIQVSRLYRYTLPRL